MVPISFEFKALPEGGFQGVLKVDGKPTLGYLTVGVEERNIPEAVIKAMQEFPNAWEYLQVLELGQDPVDRMLEIVRGMLEDFPLQCDHVQYLEGAGLHCREFNEPVSHMGSGLRRARCKTCSHRLVGRGEANLREIENILLATFKSC